MPEPRQPITYADSVPDLPSSGFAARLRELRIARLFAAANDDRQSPEPTLTRQRDPSLVEQDRPHPRPRPSSNLADEVDAQVFTQRWEAERLRAASRNQTSTQPEGDRSMSDDTPNRPADTLREGQLKASIWRNSTENGTYHSVTLARTYKDKEGNLQDTGNFRAKDMLGLSELARRAHHEVNERDRAAFKEQRIAQSEQGQSQTKGQSR